MGLSTSELLRRGLRWLGKHGARARGPRIVGLRKFPSPVTDLGSKKRRTRVFERLLAERG